MQEERDKVFNGRRKEFNEKSFISFTTVCSIVCMDEMDVSKGNER